MSGLPLNRWFNCHFCELDAGEILRKIVFTIIRACEFTSIQGRVYFSFYLILYQQFRAAGIRICYFGIIFLDTFQKAPWRTDRTKVLSCMANPEGFWPSGAACGAKGEDRFRFPEPSLSRWLSCRFPSPGPDSFPASLTRPRRTTTLSTLRTTSATPLHQDKTSNHLRS